MLRRTALIGSVFAAALLGVGEASAAVLTNESIPLTTVVFVPCANGGAGELVQLEGSLHVLMTSTVNDNTVSGKVQFQPQRLSGVGLTTGDRYQGTGITQSAFQVNLQNGQGSNTFVNNFRIIGQGPGNNYLVHQMVHVTFNANGEPTATVDQGSVECR